MGIVYVAEEIEIASVNSEGLLDTAYTHLMVFVLLFQWKGGLLSFYKTAPPPTLKKHSTDGIIRQIQD